MKTTAFCHECNSPVTVEDDSGPNPPCPACGARLKELDAYPVFISFAKPELKIAREVAAGLSEKGVRCWVAPDRLGVGAHYRAEIAKALRASKVVVLILSNAAAASDWVYKEIVYADSVRKPIFPFRVERVELSDDWALMLGNTQREDAFYEPLGRHIDRLASRVYATLHELSAPSAPKKPDAEREGAGQAEPRPALLGVNPHASPYAGPEPFSDKMLERFFGRDKDAELLIERLNASRAVLVYAPSGAGKSSLLNTKIKRALERTGHDVLLGARVGGPLPEKAPAEEVRNIYTFSAVCGLGSGVTPGPGINLADYLRLVDRRPGTRGRVLVFDQFEELFTQHADYPEHRKGFFEDLVEALEDDPALRLIFSMRQEYLADYEPLEEKFLTEFDPARFRLGRIEADGALEAIIRPAEPYAEFAEGVAEQIVDRLNTNKVRRSDGAVVSKRAEFIEMVHLQVVCTRLWERLPPGITRIEMGHVARAGGEGRTFDEFVANALDAFYEETVKEVSDSPEATRNGGFPKELIRLGCMKFVTPASTRTMVKRTSGRTGRLPDWVVKQLEDKHLLRHERRGEEEWYE
ncbi:MAG TPA: toll/interleukin-1 receptor domain-containing protein, partial [Pyrinomonadaceae bacterium]|nr:toll/interleukin-1 receptor domain-containing protein [Pyrinomonadaceae bacterium]